MTKGYNLARSIGYKPFIQLGELFSVVGEKTSEINDLIIRAKNRNRWFTEDFTRKAVNSLGNMLRKEKIDTWLARYPGLARTGNKKHKRIGVIAAGNIPLAGFHDMLCVILTGNIFIGKLSSNDDILLPGIASILSSFYPEIKKHIRFTEGKLTDLDAIIATGSDNTYRYFDYYFSKIPHILRKNRNSVAILSGDETDEEIKSLANDIFLYFGLGCRNVSKIYLPYNYDISRLFKNFSAYSNLPDHSNYVNNYDYCKAIYLVNREKFFDDGFSLLKEDPRIGSPVSVIHFEYYSNFAMLVKQLCEIHSQIQCLSVNACLKKKISTMIKQNGSFVSFSVVAMGQTQNPELWDYADGVDTMKFLLLLR